MYIYSSKDFLNAIDAAIIKETKEMINGVLVETS